MQTATEQQEKDSLACNAWFEREAKTNNLTTLSTAFHAGIAYARAAGGEGAKPPLQYTFKGIEGLKDDLQAISLCCQVINQLLPSFPIQERNVKHAAVIAYLSQRYS